MTQTFEFPRRVEFAQTDMAGLVHFSNFFHFMEETEYAFLRSLGLGVVMQDDRGKYGFPRMEVNCEYLKPAIYDDQLVVHLSVIDNNGKSLSYAFEVKREDELLARGFFKVACCRFPADGKMPYAIPLPDKVLNQIPLTEN